MFKIVKTSNQDYFNSLRSTNQTLADLLSTKIVYLKGDLKDAEIMNLKSSGNNVGINENEINAIKLHLKDLNYLLDTIIKITHAIPKD